jgi:rhodanese-related sulfurtransferase
MIQMIKNLFTKGPKTDLGELIRNGAIILDVRTPEEFRNGHLKGSVNIPLQQLRSSLTKIKKDKPVITCCASGMRSSSAKNILSSNGFSEVYNGGGWTNLREYIK